MIIYRGKGYTGGNICVQCILNRGMQRNQATFAALAPANQKHTVRLHITQAYVERFRYAKASRVDQPEECCVRCAVKRVSSRGGFSVAATILLNSLEE